MAATTTTATMALEVRQVLYDKNTSDDHKLEFILGLVESLHDDQLACREENQKLTDENRVLLVQMDDLAATNYRQQQEAHTQLSQMHEMQQTLQRFEANGDAREYYVRSIEEEYQRLKQELTTLHNSLKACAVERKALKKDNRERLESIHRLEREVNTINERAHQYLERLRENQRERRKCAEEMGLCIRGLADENDLYQRCLQRFIEMADEAESRFIDLYEQCEMFQGELGVEAEGCTYPESAIFDDTMRDTHEKQRNADFSSEFWDDQAVLQSIELGDDEVSQALFCSRKGTPKLDRSSTASTDTTTKMSISLDPTERSFDGDRMSISIEPGSTETKQMSISPGPAQPSRVVWMKMSETPGQLQSDFHETERQSETASSTSQSAPSSSTYLREVTPVESNDCRTPSESSDQERSASVTPKPHWPDWERPSQQSTEQMSPSCPLSPSQSWQSQPPRKRKRRNSSDDMPDEGGSMSAAWIPRYSKPCRACGRSDASLTQIQLPLRPKIVNAAHEEPKIPTRVESSTQIEEALTTSQTTANDDSAGMAIDPADTPGLQFATLSQAVQADLASPDERLPTVSQETQTDSPTVLPMHFRPPGMRSRSFLGTTWQHSKSRRRTVGQASNTLKPLQLPRLLAVESTARILGSVSPSKTGLEVSTPNPRLHASAVSPSAHSRDAAVQTTVPIEHRGQRQLWPLISCIGHFGAAVLLWYCIVVAGDHRMWLRANEVPVHVRNTLRSRYSTGDSFRDTLQYRLVEWSGIDRVSLG